jgi:hypothetical protein
MEADAMGDACVDTDHLLLGILRESVCQAAQQLTTAGIALENARTLVVENQPLRPDYGPVIPLGVSLSWPQLLMSRWRGGRPAGAKSALSQGQKNKREMPRSSLLQPQGGIIEPSALP